VGCGSSRLPEGTIHQCWNYPVTAHYIKNERTAGTEPIGVRLGYITIMWSP
jgi:hypothetical protein